MLFVLIFFLLQSIKCFCAAQLDDFLFHIPVRVGNTTSPFKLLLDINAQESWIVGDKSNRVLTFKQICSAEPFNISYNWTDAGFSGIFDGYWFEESLQIGVDSITSTTGTLNWTENVGFALRTTSKNTNFDGVLSLNKMISTLSKANKQLSFVTNRQATQNSLFFGLLPESQFCSNLLIYEPLLQPNTVSEWSFRLKNVTFGNLQLSTHHPDHRIRHIDIINNHFTQYALLSTLSPTVIGPSAAVRLIYQELNVAIESDQKEEFPQVDCSKTEVSPDLILQTRNAKLRVPSSAYIKQKNSKCYLLILPGHSHNQWTLGTPFHAGRCITLDYEQRRIGFADSF